MRRYDWSKERVEKAVAAANCWFDCLDRLGIPKIGGNYRTLKRKVEEYGFETGHFDYRLAKTRNGGRYKHQIANRSDEEIFKFGARIKTMNLKKEYIHRVLKDDRQLFESQTFSCGLNSERSDRGGFGGSFPRQNEVGDTETKMAGNTCQPSLVEVSGFEPEQAGPKPAVLPLHHTSIPGAKIANYRLLLK